MRKFLQFTHLFGGAVVLCPILFSNGSSAIVSAMTSKFRFIPKSLPRVRAPVAKRKLNAQAVALYATLGIGYGVAQPALAEHYPTHAPSTVGTPNNDTAKTNQSNADTPTIDVPTTDALATDAPNMDAPPVITAPPNPQPVDIAQVPAVEYSAQNFDKVINNGVPFPPSVEVNVPSYLTLSQAQAYLVQVSPKVAADNANIVSNALRADSTRNLNKPVVFIGATAAHAHVDVDIDTKDFKNDVRTDLGNLANPLPVPLPIPVPTPSDIGGLIDDSVPNNISRDVNRNLANANVTVLWSAYNGNRTQSVTDLLNGMTDESRADASLSLDEQYTTLAKRYFQTQLAIMAAYLRNQALHAIQETDHAAQRSLDVGLISRVERLEAKKALADAEYENIKALNDAQLAMTALQRMLRTPYAVRPTSPLFVSTKPLPPLAYFQQQAKQHHPAFAKVAAKYQQAQALHAFSEANYRPTVTVFGRAQAGTEDNWIAGVAANWKLWGGIDRDASRQSSLAKLHQAEFSQVDAADNIMLLVEKNWQSVKNAQQNYIALNTNIELASEMLRFRRLGFQEGVNTAVEVMQAEANLQKAKTEQAKAANDYVQALADLMQSCGTPLAFNQYMQSADIKLPAIYFEQRAS